MNALPTAAPAARRRRSQAESLREDVAHVERIARTLAPEPGTDLPVIAPALRRRAVGLYQHLRACGRSAQRASLLVGHLYGVAPGTVTQWASSRVASLN